MSYTEYFFVLKKRISNKLHRHYQEIILFFRWYFYPNPDGTWGKNTYDYGIDSCDIIYINLDHRTDRLHEIAVELRNLGVTHATRFAAINANPGALGCSLSHHTILSNQIHTTDRLCMVLEDDAQFLIDRSELDTLIAEFAEHPKMDVLCLGNSTRNQIRVSNKLAITSHTQTTSCYIFKPYMCSVLLNVFSESITRLENGEPQSTAALDQVWKKIQPHYTFVVPVKKVVVQRASFSDIEQEVVNYQC
jgi:GR25 family glycosyltransferase involved in LPS biosynthesis